MSKSKHTPGPWKAQRRKGVERRWDVVSTCETEWCIADGVPHTGCDEANARLIAAAPELLEALMGLRLYVDPMMGGEEVDNAIRAANAALAKAEGETP